KDSSRRSISCIASSRLRSRRSGWLPQPASRTDRTSSQVIRISRRFIFPRGVAAETRCSPGRRSVAIQAENEEAGRCPASTPATEAPASEAAFLIVDEGLHQLLAGVHHERA